MHVYTKPLLGLSTIQSTTFVELFQSYEQELVRLGYNHVVARLHLRVIAHFGVWLGVESIALERIDDETVAAFDRHRPRCRCPHASRDRDRHVLSCVRVFLRHLRDRRIVETKAPPEPSPLVREFIDWMLDAR